MNDSFGQLFVVATPIGNLSDMTVRGLETLRSVGLIACEDTRVTKKLLRHFEIDVPTVSLHQHSDDRKIQSIINRLCEGGDVAYVTDAGTPGVSDPGNRLVSACVSSGIRVVPIPGVSAVLAIVSVCGADLQRFLFLSYPPHKKGRETFFSRVCESEVPIIYFDSVHRVVKNLVLLSQKKPEAQIVLGRELTKMHEEIVRGRVDEVIAYFSEHPDRLKGEFVVVVL
ncbi:MAG: 16S rRNA (cytidine(1402)-2'-O)-methyltransferase [Candidatus Moranbacteria bacterium]|nr:16S rRNA (cytidine(1402)-2'-O)-methyltransferase [Candidatus Moranbacteria bacterium]